jgi:hypothetical protein
MRKTLTVSALAAIGALASGPPAQAQSFLESVGNALNPVKHAEKAVEVVSQANNVVQVITAPAQVPIRVTQGLIPGVHVNPMNPLQPPQFTTFLGAQRNWQQLPRTLDNARTFGAAELAEAIRQGERHAAMSAQPVPAWVRQALAGTVSPEILSRARFSTNWGATANVTLQQFLLANYAEAVTLNTVIVFGSPDYALYPSRENLERWRHELAHVEQYQREGIDGFAAWYARDVATDLMAGRRADPQLEKDARAIAANAVAQLRSYDAPAGYAGYAGNNGYNGSSARNYGGYAVGSNAPGNYAGYGRPQAPVPVNPPVVKRLNISAEPAPVYRTMPAPASPSKPTPSWMPTDWSR